MNQESALLDIGPYGSDRAGFMDAVGQIIRQVRHGCECYRNRTSLFHITENCGGDRDSPLSWSLGFDLKDIIVLAAMCQAPLALRGSTDKGKSALAELGLNALFGPHGRQWWRVEVSRSMALDDLVEIDLKKLSESTLGEAISATPWLSFPGRLLDEINRAPAKLNNILLHIVDGSGLHVRGNLYIPVGYPYVVHGERKRYSFTIVTANQLSADYDGVFAEDAALLRRIVVSIDLDGHPPSAQDIVGLLESRRPRISPPQCASLLKTILRVHESLPDTIPMSPLGQLYLHYLSGQGTCIRTRSGRQHPTRQSAICDKCHLSKSHKFCGRIGGVSEGLLLWIKELATGIAALRASKVLESVQRDCSNHRVADLQKFLRTSAVGEELAEAFRATYLANLSVKGEDIVAAYSLIAPNHVRIDRAWLDAQESYEHSESYAFADVAHTSWHALQTLLRRHEELFNELASGRELSAPRHSTLETLITTEDAAMLSVVSALANREVPMQFREVLGRSSQPAATVRSA